MKVLYGVFGWRGRMARGAFWLRVAAILLAFAGFDALLQPLMGGATVWVLNPPALWALVAAAARRLHDRDLPARWLLVGLLPVFGALWLLWQWCRRGSPGGNRWGADPLAPTGDFLVVG